MSGCKRHCVETNDSAPGKPNALPSRISAAKERTQKGFSFRSIFSDPIFIHENNDKTFSIIALHQCLASFYL
jgi:hypothetical protein